MERLDSDIRNAEQVERFYSGKADSAMLPPFPDIEEILEAYVAGELTKEEVQDIMREHHEIEIEDDFFENPNIST